MSNEEIILILKDMIKDAQKDANESHKAAMNSYGAGFDAGYVDGLDHALQLLETGEIN